MVSILWKFVAKSKIVNFNDNGRATIMTVELAFSLVVTAGFLWTLVVDGRRDRGFLLVMGVWGVTFVLIVLTDAARIAWLRVEAGFSFVVFCLISGRYYYNRIRGRMTR